MIRWLDDQMIRRPDDQMIRCAEGREPVWFPPPELKWRPAYTDSHLGFCQCSLMLCQKVRCEWWCSCCSDVAWLFPDWWVWEEIFICEALRAETQPALLLLGAVKHQDPQDSVCTHESLVCNPQTHITEAHGDTTVCLPGLICWECHAHSRLSCVRCQTHTQWANTRFYNTSKCFRGDFRRCHVRVGR